MAFFYDDIYEIRTENSIPLSFIILFQYNFTPYYRWPNTVQKTFITMIK